MSKPTPETITTTVNNSSRPFLRRWRNWLIAGGIVVLLAAGAGWYYLHHRPEPTGQADLDRVKKAVSRHYLLPNDEEPALATITDPSKVKTPFLKKGQSGDRVLIYQRNQTAIIYRPSADRLVAVGPVTIDTPKNGAVPGEAGR